MIFCLWLPSFTTVVNFEHMLCFWCPWSSTGHPPAIRLPDVLLDQVRKKDKSKRKSKAVTGLDSFTLMPPFQKSWYMMGTLRVLLIHPFWSILIRGVAPKSVATDVKVPPKDRLQAMFSPTLHSRGTPEAEEMQQATDMESHERSIVKMFNVVYIVLSPIAQQAWCFQSPVVATAGRREFRWGLGLWHQ